MSLVFLKKYRIGPHCGCCPSRGSIQTTNAANTAEMHAAAHRSVFADPDSSSLSIRGLSSLRAPWILTGREADRYIVLQMQRR